ncbi:MAG: hypothetical protein JW741_07560 [Sedimentisphaerales bacterium]|nr:hypothetical protein [Sedimentisphaerales bacterium]
MKKRLFYGTILAAILAGLCVAAPEPAVVQKPGQWTVQVRYEHPQQLVLPWGEKGPSRFWYTILTLTNRTGQDVEFYPRCELMTDTFQILPAGTGVPPMVFDRIKQRHAAAYPFLEPLEGVENRLLQGEDNAKDIAVIWRDFDPQASGFTVFITGLSNETAAVRHPVARDDLGLPVFVFLRKTLAVDYKLRGDSALRSSVEVAYEDQSWVMR